MCLVDTCASEVHPVFNHVTHYGYLPPNMYFSNISQFQTRLCDVV